MQAPLFSKRFCPPYARLNRSRAKEGDDGGQGHDTGAAADEARGAKERGGGGLGLSDRAHRRPRRRRHRLGRRLRRRQSVGTLQSARSHDGRDARGLQGGPPRGDARAGELRLSLRSAAGGDRQRGQGRHPAGEGRRRGHGQARRRRRLPRRGARARARGHPGVRAVRHHPADRLAIRYSLRRPVRAGSAGAAGDDGQARATGEAPGRRRRLAARLHQFGADGWRRRRARRQDSGDRRLRRWSLARRAGAPRAHRHRLRREVARTPRPRPMPMSRRPASTLSPR